MKTYRLQVAPRSPMPILIGILGCLMTINTVVTMVTMPNYLQYLIYWVTLAGDLALSILGFWQMKRHTEWMMIPFALFALAACVGRTTINWIEIILFFLLMLLMVIRIPKWFMYIIRTVSVLTGIVGMAVVIFPMWSRLSTLSVRGRLTMEWAIPFVIRTIGSDCLLILAFLLMIFSLKPPVFPKWMGRADRYDRIWE